jgi:surface antigen
MQSIIATLVTSLTITATPVPPAPDITVPVKPIPIVKQISHVEAPKTFTKLEPLPFLDSVPETYAYQGYNDYELGSCTWGVKQWKPEIGDSWGDARYWGDSAIAEGWIVSDTPVVGAVAYNTAGYYGHVGYVQQVHNDTITLREMNYDWVAYNERTRTAHVSEFRYIHK